MARQTFLQGTLILIAAGLFTRFLGFINRIVVARLMGEEGVGLYMMALPTMFLMMTLTQLGLPVAISKRVAQADAADNQAKVKQILAISLTITAASSIVFTAALILLAPFITQTLLTDDRTIYPLLIISPVLPIVSISSVLKGYFQGKQNMTPQSFALVVEQVIRIASVGIFVTVLFPYGVEFAAAGAMFSVVLGEFASLSYLLLQFKQRKAFRMRAQFFRYLRASKNTIKELFSIALPSTGSRMIGSISHFMEPILVAQSLYIAGVASSVATKQYGELTGFVLPLLFLPTFITNSLSIALVPSISEADANRNKQLIHYRIHQSIRISFASGAIATIVLSLFADTILTYMYGTDKASHYLIFMAPFFILLYIQSPLQSALQGLDLARPAMYNSLIGAICKYSILFVLASSPRFGMMGVAIAIVIGVILVTFLHLGSLYKTIRFAIPFSDLVKMTVLLAITWMLGLLLRKMYMGVAPNIFIFVGILLIFFLIYLIILASLNFITKEEWKQVPIIKSFLS